MRNAHAAHFRWGNSLTQLNYVMKEDWVDDYESYCHLTTSGLQTKSISLAIWSEYLVLNVGEVILCCYGFSEYASVGYMAKRIQMRKNRFLALQKMAEQVRSLAP